MRSLRVSPIRLGENLKKRLGVKNCPVLSRPKNVADLLKELPKLDREVLISIILDNELRALAWSIISIGRCEGILSNGRALMGDLLKNEGAGIILVHTHPDGNISPSVYEFELGETISKIAETLGFQIFDHLIMSGRRIMSIKYNSPTAKYEPRMQASF